MNYNVKIKQLRLKYEASPHEDTRACLKETLAVFAAYAENVARLLEQLSNNPAKPLGTQRGTKP